ncbi:hypothetical protein [Variovorax sp. PBS-H4]|uniref:hypothetical protein n=1 Tax=Variovorax sp. PBS-H4 TaxID=434008 RepID=UPI0013A56086|nr:hypothetical protein [Variovorax sp. PBS-H4]
MPEVPCGLCGTPTTMTGTRRCDRCWELEGRVKRDPEIALRVLTEMGALPAVAWRRWKGKFNCYEYTDPQELALEGLTEPSESDWEPLR